MQKRITLLFYLRFILQYPFKKAVVIHLAVCEGDADSYKVDGCGTKLYTVDLEEGQKDVESYLHV